MGCWERVRGGGVEGGLCRWRLLEGGGGRGEYR